MAAYEDGVDVEALLAEMDGGVAAAAVAGAGPADAAGVGGGDDGGGVLGGAGAGEEWQAGASPAYRRVQTAWLNERAAPELLPYAGVLVEELEAAVADQQQLVQARNADDTVKAFMGNLYFMEIERIKYLLRSYLRTRITKIEAMPHAVLLDETQFSRLSEQERVHLEAYVELLEQHMLAAGLAHFPAVFRNQRDIRTVPTPRLSSYVFCRVRETVGPYQLNPSAADVEDMVEGNIYAVRYDRISELVLSGKVELL